MFWKWKKDVRSIQDRKLLLDNYLNFFKDPKVIYFNASENHLNQYKNFSAHQILEWIEKTNRFIYNSIQQGKTNEEILQELNIFRNQAK